MKASKALLFFALIVGLFIAGIAVFNYTINPLCHFRCETVTADRQTVNSYYANAQRVLQFPDTELLVLGSSRGESLPLAWLSETTGLKALNLSVGGAEIHAKSAFLDFARSHLKLKKIIWIADYFELIDETAADKIRYTEALRRIAPDLGKPGIGETFRKTTQLIDHNTIEASFALLKKKKKGFGPPDRGTSADTDAARCSADLKKSKLTRAQLAKEIGIIFDGYAHKILQPSQSAAALRRLQILSEESAQKNIEFILLIPGYHPDFMARLKKEFPEIAARHKTWLKQLNALQKPGIRVLDFFAGIPGDDASPQFWSDGVHFTCHGAMEMLRQGLR